MTTPARVAQPVPAGYQAVTPWLISRDTDRLLAFMKEAFSATEIARIYNEDGSIGHAEARIGDSMVMAFDWRGDWETPCFLRLYVEDGDVVYARALAAGATEVTKMTTLFFGDRVGRIRDPLGNIWWIQTRLEHLDPAELARRAGEAEYQAAMAYVQDSLERELRSRGGRATGAG
jgi:uncharacterized glyoxalase superfamily protein PhnB